MLVRRFLALPLLLVVAACSATGSSSTPGAATPSTVASASASAAAMAHEIDTEDASLGTILVDADGNTIYFFDKDTVGVSNCTAECLATWPPVIAAATPQTGSGVTAQLGTFTRDDGTSQLTVNGHPAYYFSGDRRAGDTNGQAIGGIWWVFGADGNPIKAQASPAGRPGY